MPLSSIKEDEEIIQVLEEIDENFSAVKNTLRELRLKIGRVGERSREVVEDCQPWVRFFEVQTKQEFSPFSDLHLNSLKYKEVVQSPDNLSYSSPKNPFVEIESSELLNKSLFKELKLNLATSSSVSCINAGSNIENPKNMQNNDSEDTDYDIRPFEKSLLPEIFQDESDLIELYDFIKKHRSVSLEHIVDNFRSIPPEKLEILISVLCRKRFVKHKNSKISIEK
ncbi:uncharacterized protein VICG_00194 [Vittaforma corneae ATCC 50505]|uniref:DASH complex subunit ASK1 n=1 Tax=Vittaforma corneae (strain ATCC 50505) TaxID=993615 RepID=L2GQH5_VITCO|nr:uncharacterized protein VICG_00194 [Vittaforma corneae ATCC 50505]ELA42879.1 hypothetical protein VICG_00194 [Vittaforma corneae ATCC 50505]